MSLAVRVIPCLDVDAGRVVKGVHFENLKDAGDPVELINPMNAEQSVMRQTIIPGLLRSVAYNQAHGVKNVQLYETGKVFFAHEGKKQPKEREKVAAVLAGAMDDPSWNIAPAAFDFFDGYLVHSDDF